MLISFSKEQIIERIQFDNSWWVDGSIGERYHKLAPRKYFNLFYPLVNEKEIKRAVVLMGPRRVGKTVMLFHTIRALMNDGIPGRDICYMSMDTPIYNGIGLEELLRYYLVICGKTHKNPLFVIFDEIQYLKNWGQHLKSLVDSYPDIKFIVSGSAAAALKRDSNESGAGRFTDFMLPPLTFHEYLSLKGLDGILQPDKMSGFLEVNDLNTIFADEYGIKKFNEYFIDYINYGGYPEVSLSGELQKEMGRYMHHDIIDKVLLRDLPQLYGIDDTQELNSLFTYIAYNTGAEMSLEGISQSASVSKNTIKKYIEYLEAAFLIEIVHRIDQSAKKFKRAVNFKIYLTNPSMHCALFSPVKDKDKFLGNLVETGIFSQWQHAGWQDRLYYARWEKGEVDIVMLDNLQRPAWVAEIKWSNRCLHDFQEIRHIHSFCKTHQLTEAIVTTIDVLEQKDIDGMHYNFIPASLYCYMIGRNLIYGKMLNSGIIHKMGF